MKNTAHENTYPLPLLYKTNHGCGVAAGLVCQVEKESNQMSVCARRRVLKCIWETERRAAFY